MTDKLIELGPDLIAFARARANRALQGKSEFAASQTHWPPLLGEGIFYGPSEAPGSNPRRIVHALAAAWQCSIVPHPIYPEHGHEMVIGPHALLQGFRGEARKTVRRLAKIHSSDRAVKRQYKTEFTDLLVELLPKSQPGYLAPTKMQGGIALDVHHFQDPNPRTGVYVD